MVRTPASCVWPSLALVLTVACRDRDTQDVRRAGTFASEAVGWRAYAGDAGTRRYWPVADISPGNVAARHGAFPVLHEGRLQLAGGGVTGGSSSASSVEVLWAT